MIKFFNVKISALTVKIYSDERMGMLSSQDRFNVMYIGVYNPVALDHLDLPIANIISGKIIS